MADPSKLAQLDAIFGNLQTEMSNVGKGSDFYVRAWPQGCHGAAPLTL